MLAEQYLIYLFALFSGFLLGWGVTALFYHTRRLSLESGMGQMADVFLMRALLNQSRSLALTNELDACNQKLEQAREVLSRTESDLGAKSAQLDAALEKISTLQTLLHAREKDLGDSRTQFSKTITDLDAKSAQLDAALEKISTLQTLLQAREKELSDARTQLSKTTTDLDAKSAQLDEAFGKISTLQTLLHAREEELGDLRTQFSKMTAELDATSSKIASTEATLQARDTELESLKVQFDKMSKDLDAVLKAKSAAEALSEEYARKAAEPKAQSGEKKWSRQAPDDFKVVEGIGQVYEKRLNYAGICTFEALANATPDLLDSICQAPKFRKPDYASWIKQAQALAASKSEK